MEKCASTEPPLFVNASNRFPLLFSAVFFFFVANVGAQEEPIYELPTWKVKSIAKTAALDGDYYVAIDHFEEVLVREGETEETLRSLADMYWKSNDYVKASATYERLIELNPEDGFYLLRYALLEKKMNKPSSALSYLNRYERLFLNENPDPKIYAQIQLEKEGCEFAINHPENEAIEVARLPNNINYPHVESNPFPVGGDSLYFSSIRINKVEYMEDELPMGNIYLAQQRSDSSFQLLPFTLPISDSAANVGNLKFNEEQNLLAFTKCYKQSPTYYRCDIFMAKKQGGYWTEPQPVRQINQSRSTQTQPCFAKGPDGHPMMYFSSDRSGGAGGKDIWYAMLSERGDVGKIANCGEINTPGDEVTPWYDNKSKTLYFSSNGLPGYGSMDIYAALGYAERWASAQNVEAPINSGADDLYYVAKDTLNGYFTSNREGVNSLRGATCCDDIFTHRKRKVTNITVDGNVGFVLRGDTGYSDVKVKLYVETNGKSVLADETTVDKDGNYRFRLQPGQKYRIVSEKDGYLNSSKQVSTENVKKDTQLNAGNIEMLINTRQPIVVRNIYYPFDEDYLTQKSKVTIDTTIFDILVSNPTIKIELSSHTDSKGSDAYNIDLSQRRAQSVVDYLIEKGIQPDRLVARGYGETDPIAPNQYPDGSDNPEGRAKNRRTEFRIIGYLPQYEEVIYEQ